MVKRKQTLNQIGEEVKDHADTNDVERFEKEQQYNIASHGVIGVYWVKINTVAVGLKIGVTSR